MCCQTAYHYYEIDGKKEEKRNIGVAYWVKIGISLVVYNLFPQKVWLFQIKAVFLQHENPPSLFTMLKSAGRFVFIMVQYTKTFSSPSQLVTLLQSRGLNIENVVQTENYLRHIGYYRFSAYLYPLQTIPKENHVFKSGATFNQALDMYRFDRHLRLLMFNEIEPGHS